MGIFPCFNRDNQVRPRYFRCWRLEFLLSTIDIIRRASRPETSVLLESPDGSHFIPVDTSEIASTSGMFIYRFGAGQYILSIGARILLRFAGNTRY